MLALRWWLGGGSGMIPSSGTDFDSVFILELESFIPFANDVERRVMYMMCTPARDSLFLVHGPGSLSPQAEQSLPGPDILERW